MGFLDRLIEDIQKPRPMFRVGDEVENKLDSNLKFIVLDDLIQHRICKMQSGCRSGNGT